MSVQFTYTLLGLITFMTIVDVAALVAFNRAAARHRRAVEEFLEDLTEHENGGGAA